MAEPLSGEERNLIYLFAEFACEATHDDYDASGGGCDDMEVAATEFIRKFNTDPHTYRMEIAPGRESMREQSDVEGG